MTDQTPRLRWPVTVYCLAPRGGGIREGACEGITRVHVTQGIR